MDRASDSGSEGWGFESLLAYHFDVEFRVLFVLGILFCFLSHRQRHQKFSALGSNFWEGTEPVGHATGMSFVSLLLAHQRGNEVSCGRIEFKARYVSAVGVKEPPAALDLGRAT